MISTHRIISRHEPEVSRSTFHASRITQYVLRSRPTNQAENDTGPALALPLEHQLEAATVYVVAAEHALGASAAAPAFEELVGYPLGETFLHFGGWAGNAILALPGVGVLVGEHFEEDYLGEAIFDEYAPVVAFADEQTEAAAPAVGVEVV